MNNILLQPTNFKLIISPECQKEIDELCATTPQSKEWSGVLFFSVEGDTNDVANMVITAHHIYLADLGNAAYTEYSLDDKFINYLTSNLHLMDYVTGHIHSHHNMSTFFSNTDDSELVDSTLANESGIFLSLIVNNNFSYTAALGVRSKDIQVNLSTYAPNLTNTYKEPNQFIYKYMATIESPSKVYKYATEIEFLKNRMLQKGSTSNMIIPHNSISRNLDMIPHQATLFTLDSLEEDIDDSQSSLSGYNILLNEVSNSIIAQLLTCSPIYTGSLKEALDINKRYPDRAQYASLIEENYENLISMPIEDSGLPGKIILKNIIFLIKTSTNKDKAQLHELLPLLTDLLELGDEY